VVTSDDGIEAAKRALRVNPLGPSNSFRFSSLAVCYFCLSDYPTSIEWARKAVRHLNARIDEHLLLIASLSEHGDSDGASNALENLWTLFPQATIASLVETVQPVKSPSSFRDRLIEALRQAGLPDE
jgi:tetratricopeptide (TPR) repeat protein